MKRSRPEESDSSSDEEDTVKTRVTVNEKLKQQKFDLNSLIASYAESDDEDSNSKRGYVKQDDINRKIYGKKEGEEEEDEEDIASMKQRVKKKMRERRAKDIKRQKKKREKRREMKSGNLEIQEQKESVITLKADKKTENKVEPKKEAPVKVYKTPAYKRKHYTVSIAVPGSMLAKGDDQIRTKLCGDIARAATLFRVDEIVIFNEQATPVDMTNFLPNIRHKPQPQQQQQQEEQHHEQDDDGEQYRNRYYEQQNVKRLAMDDNVFMANILYFLETPPYLRSKLFPGTLDCLKYAVDLPPLQAPHHLMAREFPHRYRDGVTVDQNLVFIGHQKMCMLKNVNIPSGLRVTIETFKEEKDLFLGRVVTSTDPKSKEGIYWGYNVRVANSLSHALQDCPYEAYDMIVACGQGGTSVDDEDYVLPPFRHLLLVFGEANDGLSTSLTNDQRFPSGTDVRDVFDQYIDVCPHRGSRYMRTEESVMIGLSTLRKQMDQNMPPVTTGKSKFTQIRLR